MDKLMSDREYVTDTQYIDEGYCHDNDLVLAAELGKALLERNKCLEEALQKAEFAEQERMSEIKFLQKQVADLRKFSTERARSVDAAERYYQDLECKNYQLLQERTVDQERIHRLKTRVHQLEEQLHQQLIDETSDDGQPQSSTYRTRSTCSRRTTSRGRLRSGFIDDELSDQPELLSLYTPTGSTASQQLPTVEVRRGRQVGVGDGDFDRAPRSLSHPPASSRCYQTARPFEPTHSQCEQTTAPALSEAAFPGCSHTFRKEDLVCLECFDSSREVNELKAVFHEAAVMRELERIYDAQLQCQLKAIRVDGDRQQPAYHHLFAEAFQMLRNLKKQADA